MVNNIIVHKLSSRPIHWALIMNTAYIKAAVTVSSFAPASSATSRATPAQIAGIASFRLLGSTVGALRCKLRS